MLYIPRRHRRKLLLPPGLLALAFLLLVGCGVIAPIVKERTKAVLQLTFPTPTPLTFGYTKIPWESPQQLANMRQWESYEITGNKLLDWYNWQLAQRTIKALHSSPDSVRGTRIYFRQNAKYEYIIKALSYLNRNGVKKYALDMRIPDPTLYVLEYPYTRRSDYVPICGFNSQSIIYTSTPFEPTVSLNDGLSKLVQKNGLRIADFSFWSIAGLAIVIMTIRKLTTSAFS